MSNQITNILQLSNLNRIKRRINFEEEKDHPKQSW